jgi:hypothetical protein
MSDPTLRITIDAARVSPAKAIAAAARATTLVVLTDRAFRELADELGGPDSASRHLLRVATNTGRPIAANLPTGDDTSTTVFIAPKGWTDERLQGWAAGHHDVLEEAFGPATIRRAS